MRAIVINSKERTIKSDYTVETYRDIYRLGGFSLFTGIQLTPTETLFIDDEGLLHGETNYFILNGPEFVYAQPLAGNGVILGVDAEGESVDSKLCLSQLHTNVKFKRLRCLGFTPGGEREIDHPIFGKTTEIDTGRPIFEELPDETDLE
jgi:hypothetical protein